MDTARHFDGSDRVDEKEKILAIYDRYVGQLEAEHRGEYAAVTADGRVLLDTDDVVLAQKALEQFGPGSHLFKVGDIVVGKWRCLISS